MSKMAGLSGSEADTHNIGSHTPEEIAISIAAEIIAAKNGIEDPCPRSSSN